MKNKNKISNKKHWEKVMQKNNLKSIINSINNFYKTDEYNIIKNYIKNWENQKTFFEVGAAPWMYAAIFKKYFNYIPWWIEYTDNWFNSIKNLFKYLNNKNSNFIKWDFFTLDTSKKYDLVFSSWFIEHFRNYKDIIKKHIKLTKNDWYIIISVPNYHFFYKNFQELLYPWLMSKQHVIEIMDISNFTKAFKEIENQWNIEIKYLWWFWKAWFWQLVSKNKIIQKIIYLIDIIFNLTQLYKLLPKENSWIMVILKKI